MLKNTFMHIPGIGPKKEKKMWATGIQSWEDLYRSQTDDGPLSSEWLLHAKKRTDDAWRHLMDRDAAYFASRLPSSAQWRIFPEFREETAYLDIETTGLDGSFHDITVIGLYDGNHVSHYIMGENLHEFEEAIHQYKVIVTFNGKCFDVPFIERFFRTCLDHAHIDLRFVLRNLGYRGGLKACEAQMGINRGGLTDVDGWMAVLLWREFVQTGDSAALETLLAYNTQDIVNLEALLVMAYNLKLQETPFIDSHAMAVPSPPTLPFKESRHVIERIQHHINLYQERRASCP